jgi:F0F1-type ATP synthase assembly protein I
MGTGILMMVGAAVWFVVGLMGDTIFFYPPVLFVLGIISFFKGLFGSE